MTGLFAGDSRFDLTVSSVDSVPTVTVDPSTPGGWNLPPNPDASTWFGRPVAVRGSAKSLEDGNINTGLFYASNPTLAGYMMPTNDFTVEGWTRVDTFNTAVSTWRIIVQAGNGSSHQGGWTLSLRNSSDGKGYYLNFFASNLLSPSSGDLQSHKFIDGSSVVTDADILGSWHHYAVVFDYDGLEANKSTYRIYFDGRLVNTYSFTKLTPEQFTSVNSRFDLGGRSASTNTRLVGAYSYWRLSDASLAPGQFLNAGLEGASVKPDPEFGEKTVLDLQCVSGDNMHWVDMGTKLRGDACTNCTFETWVFPRSSSSINNLLCQFSGNDYRSTWVLDKFADDGLLHQKFSMYVPGPGWVYFWSKRPVRYRQWNHLALVLAGDEWRFYMNGELDSVLTGCAGRAIYGGDSSCDGVVIGNQRLWSDPPSPNGSCNALYAEARVWSRARTDEEIAANWLTRIPKPWLETGLVGYLPLDDGEPDAAADGNCARNCANIDVRHYAKSSEPVKYIQSSVKGGVWRSVSDLPVTNSAPANRAVVSLARMPNIQTNSVDSLVKDVVPHFTFTGWYLFRVRGPSSGWYENCIFSKAFAGNGRFHLREQNGVVTAWFGGGSNGATNEQLAVELNDRLPLGKWVHIGFVRDGEFVRLYLDGELVGEGGGFTLPFLASADYQFGGFNAGGSTGGFTGYLCEIGLWKMAFTADQIRNAMTARPDGTERKLMGYWPMDDAEGDALRNLKVGGLPAQPIESAGHFDWAKCANIPVLDGVMDLPPPPGLFLIVR